MLKRTVKGPLGGIRKAASRQLAHVQMVTDAFATDALSRAGFITAIAAFQILFLTALH
jgi:hypothetical protein